MRRTPLLAVASAALVLALAVPTAGASSPPEPAGGAVVPAARVGDLPLLTDPFLQAPTRTTTTVAWMTEAAGARHVVLTGPGVEGLGEPALRAAALGTRTPGVRVHAATSARLSRVAEDHQSRLPADRLPTPEQGIVEREVWRHEAVVTGLRPGVRVPYRVVSLDGRSLGASATWSLAPNPLPRTEQRILLTSDHQAMVNTPANLQIGAETTGPVDAVLVAGDLVNIPDRASEWFDDTRGSAFFPVLQGTASRAGTDGQVYRGAPLVQNAPLYAAIGNHEVQGRRAGATTLGGSYNAAVPRAVAETAYEQVAADVNPTGDPAVREAWLEDNSFSTTSYEEILTMPTSESGGERWWATTIGDVRVVSLFSTRIWRGTRADPDPAARTASSRYQEAAGTLGSPLQQGYGEHVFESLAVGSEQLRWLEQEVASPAWERARFRVVMLHEGPQGLGDNVMPHFSDPVRVEERDAAGALVGVRYEYPAQGNMLLHGLTPVVEQAGADLVLNGHSHLWNRFESPGGTHYLETSNTGNSYGAYHPLSGLSRPVPPAPWRTSDYVAQGNPGGLEPVVPSENAFLDAAGVPQPFVASNDHVVFSVLDTAANEVVTWTRDLRVADAEPVVLDRFSLGRAPRR